MKKRQELFCLHKQGNWRTKVKDDKKILISEKNEKYIKVVKTRELEDDK